MGTLSTQPPQNPKACQTCPIEGLKVRCKQCRAFRQTNKTEYQTAYRPWSWQHKLPCFKPGNNGDPLSHNDNDRKGIADRTTYRLDFDTTAKKLLEGQGHARRYLSNTNINIRSTQADMDAPRLKLKRVQIENSKVIQPGSHAVFSKDTNYVVSYKGIDADTMKECRQPPIKAKDNIEVPGTGDAMAGTKSTAQDDYVAHSGVEKREPVKPIENTERPTQPLVDDTEYKQHFIPKPINIVLPKKPKPRLRAVDSKPEDFKPLSTAMADFVAPVNPIRPSPCVPPVSDHFSKDKFEDSTTCSRTYKEWPMTPYETPKWAIKPTYKRPKGGMLKKSLYKSDYNKPEWSRPPAPIIPQSQDKNIISDPSNTDPCLVNLTTYTNDYKGTVGHPPDSFKVLIAYTAPKEKMECLTNMKDDFRGEQTERRLPCRHPSQHRDLNPDRSMSFGTTYKKTFRPLTTPCRANTETPSSAQDGTRPNTVNNRSLTSTLSPCNISKKTGSKESIVRSNTYLNAVNICETCHSSPSEVNKRESPASFIQTGTGRKNSSQLSQNPHPPKSDRKRCPSSPQTTGKKCKCNHTQNSLNLEKK